MSETVEKSKFIFTTEGRNSLVSQLGGIRFAILGAVLIHGLDIVDPESFFDTYKGETLESLTSKPGVILGLKNVNYITSENGISPENNYVYLEAIHNITNNLIPLHYIPSTELADDKTSVFGNYELEFDKTLINWDNAHDVTKFNHIGFIGKQYAQTDDATYNVEKTQKPVLAGIAQIAGAQLLAEQNEYVNTKLRIRLTLDDQDEDIAPVVKTEAAQELLDIADKMSLVNNGVKTVTSAFFITDNKQIVDDFKLNPDGAVAMTKTLMVAEPYDANELENDFNGVGLLHLINAKDAVREYTPQVVLSTFEGIERDNGNPTSPINAYNVKLLLRGTSGEQTVAGNAIDEGYDLPYEDSSYSYSTSYNGTDYYGTDATGAENEAFNYDYEGYITPIFKMEPIPADDELAVEFFGINNKILGTDDRVLFSKNNILFSKYINSSDEHIRENLLLTSNSNFLDTAKGSNVLIGSDNNALKNGSTNNSLLNSNYNIFGHDVKNINIFGSTDNFINTNVSYAGIESYDIFLTLCEKNNIDATRYGILANAWNNEFVDCNSLTIFNTHDSVISEGYSIAIINGNANNVKFSYNDTIINGKDNNIDNSDQVVMIGNNLFVKDYNENFADNEPTEPLLILGKFNNYDAEVITDAENRPMQPGIIYGFGSSNNARQNVLEFYPYNGLLRLYNKRTAKWTEIGGDTGLKIPNNNIEAKSVTVNESVKMGSTTEGKMISIDKTQSSPTIKLFTQAGTTSITERNVTVKGPAVNPNERIEVNNKSINFYNSNNKLVTKIDKDSHYQKARADIAIKAKTDMAQAGFECSVLSYHGPKAIGDWIRKIWEIAPPFVYTTNNTSETNNAIYSIYTSNTWTKAANRTTFASFVTSEIGSNTCLVATNSAETKYLSYIDSDIIKNELDLDELEINLFVDDYAGYDMHLLWALDEKVIGNTSPLINTEIKLNVFINSCAYSNDEGETLHFWSFNKNGGAYRNVEMSSYDRFTTLIAKPGSLKLYQNTPVGWWRMN